MSTGDEPMRQYINSQIFKQKATSFSCPTCKTPWPYRAVKRAAKMSAEEMMKIEEEMSLNHLRRTHKQCPRCQTW